MKSNFTFLIQTINGEVKHDFSFELLNSIQYLNWYYNSTESFRVQNPRDIGHRIHFKMDSESGRKWTLNPAEIVPHR